MRVAHSCEQKRERNEKKKRAEPKKYDVERENNIYILIKKFIFFKERERERKKHNIHIYTI